MVRTGQVGLDTSTPAVVLKLDPNVLHHGGLGVIRSLGRAGVPTYAVHEDSFAPAAQSRYVLGRWLWRPAVDDAEQVLRGLSGLAEHLGRPAVLFPTDDAGAIFLAEHAEKLRDSFLFPAPPRDLPRQVAEKFSLSELCGQLGEPSVRTVLIGQWEDVLGFVGETGFPVVAKLAAPWLAAGARDVRSTTIVRGWAELENLHRACAQQDVGGLMLQEFIPGGLGTDWFFHGYCDADSVCAPACTGVKERSYPTHAGLTSLGRSVDNPALREQATRLLRGLGFRGIVDLDFRWDERDRSYKLLDFNPRLGAQFRLFRDACGVDVALAAYADLTGQPVRAGDPVPDRRLLVENYDPMAAFGYWRRHEIRLRGWAGSLRSVSETAWFARDDLVPFALMCVWMVRRVLARVFGQRRVRTARALTSHRTQDGASTSEVSGAPTARVRTARLTAVPTRNGTRVTAQPQYSSGRATTAVRSLATRRRSSHRSAEEDRT